MRLVKIPAIFSTVADVGCIRKGIFNTLDSRINFWKEHLFCNAFIFHVICFRISWSSYNIWLENDSNIV